MKQTVDIDRAKQTILDSLLRVQSGWKPEPRKYGKIEAVISGSHLTYRYILYTALVAKNTNPLINALAIQQGSDLLGAYDARSVCHKAVVPIERSHLGGRLGESNEPFLNKPARTKELSLDNPVRAGNDRRLLAASIDVLTELNDANAQEFLDAATYFLLQRPSREIGDLLEGKAIEYGEILKFVRKVIHVSDEGQASVVVVGAALSVFCKTVSVEMDVRVHPVNQAGSSSNEIGDIDVRLKGAPLFSLEIKDKDFSDDDVNHAVKKAVEGGLTALLFVSGPHSQYAGRQVSILNFPRKLRRLWEEQGFNLEFWTVESLVRHYLSMCGNFEPSIYARECMEVAKRARVKDLTFNRILELAKGL
ncbi:restriction endonuclease, SacI family [Thalassospira sp. HJ]|uniref:restriction endonuclease, SacI family n=1 Tax=Thalassospira sp. HJ TaxID=1616823 RepID=UPI00069868A0|nr:restriction endonuclease, SacI family [Thalassospira sp. HJ]